MKFLGDGYLEEVYWGSGAGPYTVMSVEDWISEGKYEVSYVIFSFDGKFYRLPRHRTGSYYSEYHYDIKDWDVDVECAEVEEKMIVRYEWVVKE